ncbi:DUF2511 domain-containing protein [uncultured Deinococcus sp.]|uniref:DUF2511 domain-containing protein n=1 Tax=uncultured Deinococcus sp. TaxID=158789 RepID=UPI00338ECB91
MTARRRVSPVLWFALAAGVFLALLIGAAVYAVPKPSPTTQTIGVEDLGAKWPLTFERGELACLGQAITIKDLASNITYALNGAADGAAREFGWSDVRPVWKDAPTSMGIPKLDISPLIDRGLSLCR